MTTIGTNAASTSYLDRSVYAQKLADASGQTVEEVTAHLDATDQMLLKSAQNQQLANTGKGIPVGNTTAQMVADSVANVREERTQYYARIPGSVSINAIDVGSAVKAQGAMTGGDLKNLSLYADYLRSEVGAATSARSDATFTGTWGKDQVTHDVNEYIGWLMQAAQGKPQAS
jgi:hypothetical protein